LQLSTTTNWLHIASQFSWLRNKLQEQNWDLLTKGTENKLVNHTLKYVHSYHSNWGSGGGTSTQKSFTIHADHSFRCSYSSVVSPGNMAGGTSQDEGWGMWKVQESNKIPVLILRWHLKPVSAYHLQWGEPGIIYLAEEKYLLA
jgi:hypothetical protein